MNYQEMKASHETQIEALLADDYAALSDMFPNTWRMLINHDSVWMNTGADPLSLFAVLPGCNQCLTQIKGHVSLHAEKWEELLGISQNNLIPRFIRTDTVFTREQLEEFSRLQLLANFPEGDVT